MVSRKILVIFVVLLLVVVSYPFWSLFFIVGAPTPLFSVSNYDNVSHTIAVEIIGPDNTSIFNDSRNLDPDEHWSHPKPLYMVSRSYFAWGEDRYTVYATMDYNVTRNMTINYHLWNNPRIKIYDGTLIIGEITV